MSPSPSGATTPDPDRPTAGHRDRLTALHQLAPGLAARPIPVAVAFLMAASTPAEREAAAQAHDAQAAQLRGPIPAALADAFGQLQQLWQRVGFRTLDPAATVAELLTLADPQLAGRVREVLTGAGVDPDALRWPPVVIWPGWPGA